MRNVLMFIILCCICLKTNAQVNRYGLALDDNVNVNDSYYENEGYKNVTDATFRIYFQQTDGTSSFCTGTLINRNTPDENVAYYFLTARHCIYTNNGMGDNVFDANAYHYLVFNYQSPTENNEDAPTSNRGKYMSYSVNLSDSAYQYIHKTKLRLVDKFFWGDFALFEILTPIPPHFNVSYAGWEPSRLGSVSTGLLDPYPTVLVGIHHPRGDIKKISGSNDMLWLENPISSGCYIITTIIDFLFGWIWGNSASTQVICNYVDNPWLSVIWTYGTTEQGSSGSGLFAGGDRLIGVLSGGLEFYGKLHANYYNASIKNVLNPANDIWVDHSGLNSRKITIYDNLTLPGGNYNEAYYFPANHYQSENKITLRATDSITTNKPITILEGANYEFVAGNSIELNPGFIVKEGATFTARIGSSPQNAPNKEKNMQSVILNKLANIKLPEVVKNNENKMTKTYLKCYPNPATDYLFVEFDKEAEIIEIFSTSGIKSHEQKINTRFEKIDLTGYSTGVYLIKVYYKDAGLEFLRFVKN